jgi:hypothetical protein
MLGFQQCPAPHRDELLLSSNKSFLSLFEITLSFKLQKEMI